MLALLLPMLPYILYARFLGSFRPGPHIRQRRTCRTCGARGTVTCTGTMRLPWRKSQPPGQQRACLSEVQHGRPPVQSCTPDRERPAHDAHGHGPRPLVRTEEQQRESVQQAERRGLPGEADPQRADAEPPPEHGKGRRHGPLTGEEQRDEPPRDDLPDGEPDERRGDVEAVGGGVQHLAEAALLVQCPRDLAVQPVGEAGRDEQGDRGHIVPGAEHQPQEGGYAEQACHADPVRDGQDAVPPVYPGRAAAPPDVAHAVTLPGLSQHRRHPPDAAGAGRAPPYPGRYTEIRNAAVTVIGSGRAARRARIAAASTWRAAGPIAMSVSAPARLSRMLSVRSSRRSRAKWPASDPVRRSSFRSSTVSRPAASTSSARWPGAGVTTISVPSSCRTRRNSAPLRGAKTLRTTDTTDGRTGNGAHTSHAIAPIPGCARAARRSARTEMSIAIPHGRAAPPCGAWWPAALRLPCAGAPPCAALPCAARACCGGWPQEGGPPQSRSRTARR